MQQIDCPLCGASHSTLLFRARDILLSVPGEFAYVRCDHCGLAYLNPQPSPDELGPHYAELYDSFQHASLRRGWARRLLVRHGFRERQRQIERLKPGGNLLEVGAADGAFLHVLAESGRWNVTGVETSAVAVRTAWEVYGQELISAQLEEAGLPRGHYDVVAMWDVLEHLPRPLAALREIRAVLKPDGLLLLRLPLADAWDARLFGRHWAGWDAPHHLTVMGRSQLDSLLSKAGLRAVRVSGIQSCLSCLAPSLRRWATTLPRIPRSMVGLVASSAVFQAALAPLSWFVAWLWPVSCQMVVARLVDEDGKQRGGRCVP